jgi:hypothetical protein
VNNAFNNCLTKNSSGIISVKVQNKEKSTFLIKTLYIPIILNENVSGVQAIGKVLTKL